MIFVQKYQNEPFKIYSAVAHKTTVVKLSVTKLLNSSKVTKYPNAIKAYFDWHLFCNLFLKQSCKRIKLCGGGKYMVFQGKPGSSWPPKIVGQVFVTYRNFHKLVLHHMEKTNNCSGSCHLSVNTCVAFVVNYFHEQI